MTVAIDQLHVLEEIKCKCAVAASAAGVVVAATAFGVVVAVPGAGVAGVALDIAAESIVAESAVYIFAADGVASSSLIFVVVVVNNDAFFGPSLKPPPPTMAHLQLLSLGSGLDYCCLRY